MTHNRPSRACPRLNFDILREVALCSDRATCAALVRCCRSLYHEAAKVILSERVVLDTEECVAGFLEFLNADDKSRFRYVRDVCLDIDLSYPLEDDETMGCLVDGIARMTRLERLELPYGEDLLDEHPVVADVIAKATSLRFLHIKQVGPLVCSLLESMQSNLTSVRLDWTSDTEDFLETQVELEDLAEYHPVPFLAKWSSTLEELVCESWKTSLDVPTFTQVYPNLRLLKLKGDNFPLVVPYTRAYPNLKQLHFETDGGDNLGHHSHMDDVRAHRELNIAAQLASGGPGTWQCLQECSGNLVDLYLLGLTCPVLTLRLSGCIEARHLFMLGSVLSYAQPRHLVIEGDGALLLHPKRGLPVLLRRSAAARLETLSVKIILNQEDNEFDFESCFVRSSQHPSDPIRAEYMRFRRKTSLHRSLGAPCGRCDFAS